MTALDVGAAPVPASSRPDAILAAVGAAAHRFLTMSAPWEETALAVLAQLGEAAGASRAYLFANYLDDDQRLCTRRLFQWSTADAPSQDGIEAAVDFAFDDIGLDRWAGILAGGEPVHGVTRDLPTLEQEELRIEGILSIALVPVFVEGRWWGFVGFDECVVERPWTPAELEALRAAAGIFAAVVGRQRTRELLEQRVAALARIAAELVAGTCLDQRLDILAQSVVSATGAFACSVSLLSTDAADLLAVEQHGLPEGYAVVHRRLWDEGTNAETLTALATHRTIVIEDLAIEAARDARYDPLLAVIGETGSGALVVVPLLSGDTPLGIVHAYYRRPGPVHPDELTFLQAIADHGAVAVEHARLVDEAARSTLLEERARLSRELHDSVSQAVYGIALGARTARKLLDTDPARVVEPLDYVLELAEAGLAEMRALIFELRPESLQREGLVVALTKQAQAVQARHRLAVRIDLPDEPDLPLAAKEVVYRVAQEALHNIVKHAKATAVAVELVVADDDLVLRVHDDGQGFDPSGEFPGHLGLHSMRERAEGAGGTLAISSTPGSGTTVELTLPASPV